MSKIGNKTIGYGFFWNIIQKFSSLSIGFVSSVILARILNPSDYGALAVIMIFISIANLIIDSGFGNAIIQNQNTNNNDINTVFTINLILSAVTVIIIFFSAPAVETFFSIKNISVYIRVDSIQILCRAFYLIQYTMMIKKMKFKELAMSNTIATAASSALAICMAYNNFGIFSLVVRNITQDIILLFAYKFYSNIKVTLGLSKKSFIKLFSFSCYSLMINVLSTVNNNILSFVIGKKTTISDLGYYNQGYTIQQTIVYSITSVISQVLFPYFSKIQNVENKVLIDIKNTIMAVSFIVFPIILYLIVFSEQIIGLVYSEKWIPCAIYFKIFCAQGIANILINIYISALKSLGRIRTVFNIQLISISIGLLLFISLLNISLVAAVLMVVVTSVIFLILVMLSTKQIIDFRIFDQLNGWLLNLTLSVISAFIAKQMADNLNVTMIFQLIFGAVILFVCYIVLHFAIDTEGIKTFKRAVWKWKTED